MEPTAEHLDLPAAYGSPNRLLRWPDVEQRLTEAVVNGLPLVEAAEQLGIRLSTARTRLKAIQAKTHCHRQVDLVRLALSLPAVRQS